MVAAAAEGESGQQRIAALRDIVARLEEITNPSPELAAGATAAPPPPVAAAATGTDWMELFESAAGDPHHSDPRLPQVLESALSHIDTAFGSAAGAAGRGEQQQPTGTGAAGAAAELASAAGPEADGDGDGAGAAPAVDEDVVMADVELMQRMEALLTTPAPPASAAAGRRSTNATGGTDAPGRLGAAAEAAEVAADAAARAEGGGGGSERGSRQGAGATEDGAAAAAASARAMRRSTADNLRRTIERLIERRATFTPSAALNRLATRASETPMPAAVAADTAKAQALVAIEKAAMERGYVGVGGWWVRRRGAWIAGGGLGGWYCACGRGRRLGW